VALFRIARYRTRTRLFFESTPHRPQRRHGRAGTLARDAAADHLRGNEIHVSICLYNGLARKRLARDRDQPITTTRVSSTRKIISEYSLNSPSDIRTYAAVISTLADIVLDARQSTTDRLYPNPTSNIVGRITWIHTVHGYPAE